MCLLVTRGAVLDGFLLIDDSKADVEEVGDYEAKVESKDGFPTNLKIRSTLNIEHAPPDLG